MICLKCDQDKPENEFGVNKARPSGRCWACKTCLREVDRIRYWKDPAKGIEKTRRYRKEHPEKIEEWLKRNPGYQSQWSRTETGKESRRASTRRWRRLNPEAKKAHEKANSVPLLGVCVICGNKKRTERHHPDYSRATLVVELCRKCHVLIHSTSEIPF